jgi:hypothetical protein
MRTNVIAAAALLVSLSVLQTPALAENQGRARLHLNVVDGANAPLPNATVTVYTMHGPRVATTDQTGVVVFADVPAEMTQWWAQMPGHLSSADATRLKPGKNTQTVTLQMATPAAESAS